MKTILLFLSLYISQQLPCHSSPLNLPKHAEHTIREGISLLYNLHFTKALNKFHSLLPQFHNHPAPWFFKGMVYWIKMINMDDSPLTARLFLKNTKKAIYYANKRKNNYANIFFKAGSLGFLGRYYLNNKQWLQAAQTGWEAYKLLATVKSKHTPADIQLGLGFFNFYAGKLPKALRTIAAVLGIKGDWRKGLRQLHHAAQYGKFTRIESRIILAHLYTYQLRRGYNAIRILTQLCRRFPRNTRFHMTLADAYNAVGNQHRAISIANISLQKVAQKKISRSWLFLIHSRLGKFYLWSKEYKKALNHLIRAIHSKPYKPENYLAWVYMRIGKILIHLNKKRLARTALKKTISLGYNGKAAAIAQRLLKKCRN